MNSSNANNIHEYEIHIMKCPERGAKKCFGFMAISLKVNQSNGKIIEVDDFDCFRFTVQCTSLSLFTNIWTQCPHSLTCLR